MLGSEERAQQDQGASSGSSIRACCMADARNLDSFIELIVHGGIFAVGCGGRTWRARHAKNFGSALSQCGGRGVVPLGGCCILRAASALGL
jgi:hypothetical protein